MILQLISLSTAAASDTGAPAAAPTTAAAGEKLGPAAQIMASPDGHSTAGSCLSPGTATCSEASAVVAVKASPRLRNLTLLCLGHLAYRSEARDAIR